jgi:hypothetical protein
MMVMLAEKLDKIRVVRIRVCIAELRVPGKRLSIPRCWLKIDNTNVSRKYVKADRRTNNAKAMSQRTSITDSVVSNDSIMMVLECVGIGSLNYQRSCAAIAAILFSASTYT